MGNINTFAENVTELTKNVNVALEALSAINESLVTTEDRISINVVDDASITTYQIPSYNNIINRLDSTTNTVSAFVVGTGVVETQDGTFRQIKATPIPIAPSNITNLISPTQFSINTNWFFEDLMFPKLVVTLDLKDKIDDLSDRVMINRIILDTTIPANLQFFNDSIVGTDILYPDLITLLTNNNIFYYEDIQEVNLPLTYEKFNGSFNITNVNILNGNEWIYLNNISYGVLNEDGIVLYNYNLSIGDKLKYKETVYEITDLNITEKRIRIKASIGIDNPGINGEFTFFNDPFINKNINIGIGYDEANIIFLKGVNENFNIVSNQWSNGITFYSNDLILDTNNQMKLEEFYAKNVVDFGKKMLSEAKDKYITAFNGIVPNTPILDSKYFKVVQINTQINASLDTESIKNTQTQIETTKSNIDSLKSTIAQQKAELITAINENDRKKLEQQIANNTNSLSVKQVEYNSLVKYLITVAYENNAVFSSPKYRIRGFFPIPASQYTNNDPIGGQEQNIISFDIAYRYLKLDDSGSSLNTFNYTDPSTGQVITGVYTDWNIYQTDVLQKVYDSSLGIFMWKNETVSNGEINNINQIDIPITKGEKVEIKIRSISEAGYPSNPIKSQWSSSVILDFPSNLETSDQIKNILTDATNEQTNILLNESMSATGIFTHLSDSVPNPNSVNNVYFKHESKFIAYENKTTDANGNINTITIDVQTIIDDLKNRIRILESK